jgi:hypothetical protein
MAEYWRYAVSRTASLSTSRTQPNGYNSYDRRPVAICPRVTHNKDAREENKRKYVLVFAKKEI